DPQRPTPSGVRVWNGSDPSARLAVYRNNVVSSLVDALAETFPVVEQLVGSEFFRAMAVLFVRQAPPRSRVLAHYGQAFPSFIADFEPAQGLPYLADMARLEVARVAAYHAADADSVSAAMVSLALACGDRMGELQLFCIHRWRRWSRPLPSCRCGPRTRRQVMSAATMATAPAAASALSTSMAPRAP
ncbi:HvfC/BufC family peptide modification chaperone, partial [Roseateles sp. GG27B]